MTDDKGLLDRHFLLPPEVPAERMLSGIRALVLATNIMAEYDRRDGKNTEGFVSGYPGSPLAGLDQQFRRAQKYLEHARVRFQPALNEDLAATAVWGTQRASISPYKKVDGVFGLWFGKGPGADRTADVFKHANAAGTAPFGGVLAVAGDDHLGKSSTMPHQSDFLFRHANMPVLYPADVQDILEFAIKGWWLSRFSGSWVGFKVVGDVADETRRVVVPPFSLAIPEFEFPAGGLSIRSPDPLREREIRMRMRLLAAKVFANANCINRITHDSLHARLGIVASGKSYRDTLEALQLLGIDEGAMRELGINIYKVGMPWPLDIPAMSNFLAKVRTVLVVEEKLNVVEDQLRAGLYGSAMTPTILGKTDRYGKPLLTDVAKLGANEIALAIASELPSELLHESIRWRIADLKRTAEAAKQRTIVELVRVPYFCSGCPHNTSTKLPEGSHADAGIGCHFMRTWMDDKTLPESHMGGEGGSWVGEAPYVSECHRFVNLGDGTYSHSGLLAIKNAVEAGSRVTYKILFNDAVAMTGGQAIFGARSVAEITNTLRSERVARIAVASDEPEKYGLRREFASGVTFHHRDDLDQLQRELRAYDGVSVLIYDQTCAAEKRRRRKKGRYPDPPMRTFINSRVCEGCGDCGVASNCLSVQPLETVFGRKRTIDQSSCNKDFSCTKGFCPSFVTVHDPKLRARRDIAGALFADASKLPEPTLPKVVEPWNVLVAGVGGMGVITLTAILAQAAHASAMNAIALDMTGLSQKYGSVWGHIRFCSSDGELHSVEIPSGSADVILGGDLIVSASPDTLSYARTLGGGVQAVVNDDISATSQFLKDPDIMLDPDSLKGVIVGKVSRSRFFHATRYVELLFGDTISTNMFMLGMAYQLGAIPVPATAIMAAVEWNKEGVEVNQQAFVAGRFAAIDPEAFTARFGEAPKKEPKSVEELIEHFSAELTAYQDEAYARRFRRVVEGMHRFELEWTRKTALTETVARAYFKLLAYKDEYEVGRLHSLPHFRESLDMQFSDYGALEYNLAPPLFAKRDSVTGHLRKMKFGRWMGTAMHVLAHFKFLRGSMFDPFGYTKERKEERALIGEYESLIATVRNGLSEKNYSEGLAVLSAAIKIRGYGHVKERSIAEYRKTLQGLLADFRGVRRSGKIKLADIPIVVVTK